MGCRAVVVGASLVVCSWRPCLGMAVQRLPLMLVRKAPSGRFGLDMSRDGCISRLNFLAMPVAPGKGMWSSVSSAVDMSLDPVSMTPMYVFSCRRAGGPRGRRTKKGQTGRVERRVVGPEEEDAKTKEAYAAI